MCAVQNRSFFSTERGRVDSALKIEGNTPAHEKPDKMHNIYCYLWHKHVAISYIPSRFACGKDVLCRDEHHYECYWRIHNAQISAIYRMQEKNMLFVWTRLKQTKSSKGLLWGQRTIKSLNKRSEVSQVSEFSKRNGKKKKKKTILKAFLVRKKY